MKKIIVSFLAIIVCLQLTAQYPKTNQWGWPNSYSPQSTNAPTVGTGVDLTEDLKKMGLSQDIIDSISKDINGRPRPKGRWDIGAYQLITNDISSYPSAPKNLRLVTTF